MDTDTTTRSNTRLARIVRDGLKWGQIYGHRSAAAYLVYRRVPRDVIDRVLRLAGRVDDLAG